MWFLFSQNAQYPVLFFFHWSNIFLPTCSAQQQVTTKSMLMFLIQYLDFCICNVVLLRTRHKVKIIRLCPGLHELPHLLPALRPLRPPQRVPLRAGRRQVRAGAQVQGLQVQALHRGGHEGHLGGQQDQEEVKEEAAAADCVLLPVPVLRRPDRLVHRGGGEILLGHEVQVLRQTLRWVSQSTETHNRPVHTSLRLTFSLCANCRRWAIILLMGFRELLIFFKKKAF